jgi:hypothetical protein
MAQLTLAIDQHLIQAFAAKRANQTFGNAILPGRSGRYRTITNAHRSDPGGEDLPVGPVIIAQQVDRRRCSGERLCNLSSQPFGCRMPGHVKPQQLDRACRCAKNGPRTDPQCRM